MSGDPSYGSPAGTAQRIKAPVKLIPVDSKLALDLEGMIRASIGAGLVFLCNPNNPTSSVASTAEVEQTVRTIKQRSPETGILIDEAYLEYATAPGSGTLTKLALELPGVFVSQTFSKAYGMAGMRMGYGIGQPETMSKVGRAWGLGDINELQAVAGIAALKDTAHMDWERQENKRVRDWTQAQFREMGFETPESQTNFIFVNIRRPAVEFRDACCRARRVGWPRLPADGEELRAHLARHDGRHAEGDGRLQTGAGQDVHRLIVYARSLEGAVAAPSSQHPRTDQRNQPTNRQRLEQRERRVDQRIAVHLFELRHLLPSRFQLRGRRPCGAFFLERVSAVIVEKVGHEVVIDDLPHQRRNRGWPPA